MVQVERGSRRGQSPATSETPCQSYPSSNRSPRSCLKSPLSKESWAEWCPPWGGVAGLVVLGRRREEEQVLMRGELQNWLKEMGHRGRIKEQERRLKRMAADPIGSNC